MTRLYVPGVPKAGHLTDSNYWHPGPIEGCPKCPHSCSQCGAPAVMVRLPCGDRYLCPVHMAKVRRAQKKSSPKG